MSEKLDRDGMLQAVAAKRGYVLSYHRLLAADDPELLRVYDQLYTRITLDDRTLTRRQKELVWLALLSAREEPTGHIHVERAMAAGLTAAEMADALTLTSVAQGYRTSTFASNHWSDDIPDNTMNERYHALVETARGAIDPALAQLIAVIIHASLRQFGAMPQHLQRAFSLGVTAAQMREAFSFLLLPCGGNVFIHAVDTWQSAAEHHQLPQPF